MNNSQRLTQGKMASTFGTHGLFSDSTVTMMADQISTVFQ